MTFAERLLEIPITVVLIIGGYQFYFWCQRQNFYPARTLETRFDDWIAFDPRWVWVYSGLYYPMILLVALVQPDWESYANTVGGFLFLLACQMFFFLRFPVAIPAQWRIDARNAAGSEYPRSMKFLETVWSYDKLRNSLPSMHVSVAMMVDLSVSQHWHSFATVGWIFPGAIAASALKTKQHYVVDVLPGALMGIAAFYIWHRAAG